MANEKLDPNPLGHYTESIYMPNYFDKRVAAQSAAFTIHPNPENPFGSNEIDKIIIPINLSLLIEKHLWLFGNHAARLFP